MARIKWGIGSFVVNIDFGISKLTISEVVITITRWKFASCNCLFYRVFRAIFQAHQVNECREIMTLEKFQCSGLNMQFQSFKAFKF